ncbi:MAG: flagellar biosynthesis regulator FlaF [Alphaproteobacteria bacterium]|nr:flagellar biosynthesis regulator FlaF [Alphaproteobacteria bacterium]
MSPNPYQNVNVYNKNQKTAAPPMGNSRATDARALLTCAGKLDEAKTLMIGDPKSKENIKLYGEAIRFNQRLWTIFQVALSDPENPLPEDLRAILLGLSSYIDRTSFRAVGKYQPELIDSLISIDRIIAAGLSKTPKNESAESLPVDMRDIPISLMTSA